jgi:proton-translocating NADH-quinone oxidoreductase chain N
MMLNGNAVVLYPILVLLLGALLSYILGKVAKRYTKYVSGGVAAAASSSAMGLFLFMSQRAAVGESLSVSFISGGVQFALNPLALFLSLIGIFHSFILGLYSIRYMEHETGLEKYFALMLLMTAGIIGIALAQDLFDMYVFFELMAVASFALVAFQKQRWEPIEAGTKYAIMSTVGSIIALFGISTIFLYAGTLQFDKIGAGLNATAPGAITTTILMAGGLMIIGFGVKAAVVPFHTWLPDAHSAAPIPIHAFLSGIVIQSALVALIKAIQPLAALGVALSFGLTLALFASVSMFVGNLIALKQRDLKRMLAYSSIAQMGYILLGFAFGMGIGGHGVELGFTGGLYQILGHAYMKSGAFLCVGGIMYAIGTSDLEKMRGVGRTLPLIGLSYSLLALALSGLPPTVGFVSELLICMAGATIRGWGLVFVVILIINIVLSVGYYVPTINTIMFSQKMGNKVKDVKPVPRLMVGAILLMTAITLVLGIYPQLGMKIVQPAAEYLFHLFSGS